MKPAATLRALTAADGSVVHEMLYHALYVPAGQPPLDRGLMELPEIARYAAGWGREGDGGYAALTPDTGEPLGAVWLRLWPDAERGYGFVDAAIPELSIAVVPGRRGQGLGTRLLEAALTAARTRWRAVSLSVAPDNPALRLYQRFGFRAVGQHGGALILKVDL